MKKLKKIEKLKKSKFLVDNRRFRGMGIDYFDTPDFIYYHKVHRVKISIYDSPEFLLRHRISFRTANIQLSKIYLLLKKNQFEFVIVLLKRIRENQIDRIIGDYIYFNADNYAINYCLEKYPKESIGDYIETLLLIDNLKNLPLTIKRIKKIKGHLKTIKTK